ncbi:hypothetical protein IFM89_024541 [Coptis chinensis]|uniref:Conserved oligomeric Golgi complex subunit 7 n=1 Tax=Coptis chinensis TaxID=261450 RepID=A0A835HMB4_9MAGN|nr:hypothetical protein IFM89_024541 [Coptis chinensis]
MEELNTFWYFTSYENCVMIFGTLQRNPRGVLVLIDLLKPTASRGWMGLSFALLILFIAIFMLLNRWFNKGRPIYELKDGNVVLLKLQALSLSVFLKTLYDLRKKKKSVAKKEGVEEGEAAVVEEVKRSQHVLRKLEKRKEEQQLDSHIEEQLWWCLVHDVALSFRSYVSSILLKLRKAEGTSGEFIDALAKVDIVKQRMEAAYETLQDVAGLTQLSASVEDVFASGDLPQVAETLANMRHCLFVAVGEVAEFANVRKQLEVLEDRLEEMLQPRLSEALSLSTHTHSDWKKPRRNCSTSTIIYWRDFRFQFGSWLSNASKQLVLVDLKPVAHTIDLVISKSASVLVVVLSRQTVKVIVHYCCNESHDSLYP